MTGPLFSLIPKHLSSLEWSACLTRRSCSEAQKRLIKSVCCCRNSVITDDLSVTVTTDSLPVKVWGCLGKRPFLRLEKQRLTGVSPSEAAWRRPGSAGRAVLIPCLRETTRKAEHLSVTPDARLRLFLTFSLYSFFGCFCSVALIRPCFAHFSSHLFK